VSRGVGIGQGNPEGTVTQEDANHITMRIYEREGDNLNPEYDTMFNELRVLREVSRSG